MNKLRTIGGKKYIILSSNKIMQAYIIINGASSKKSSKMTGIETFKTF